MKSLLMPILFIAGLLFAQLAFIALEYIWPTPQEELRHER